MTRNQKLYPFGEYPVKHQRIVTWPLSPGWTLAFGLFGIIVCVVG